MTDAQVLKEAARKVKKGWFQLGKNGSFVGKGTYHCLMSAIVNSLTYTEKDLQWSRLVRTIKGRIDNPFKWNDAPERTQAEVIQLLLDLAAVLEENAESEADVASSSQKLRQTIRS